MSDNVDTLMGLRMAGVEGVVIHEEAPLRSKLEDLLKEDDIAVIMITTKLIDMIRETVNELKLSLDRPLLIEIPDRHGGAGIGDSLARYVKEAIGVSLSSAGDDNDERKD